MHFGFRRILGDVPVLVRGSRAATKLSNYFTDRDKLLGEEMSAEEFEVKWRDVRVAGREMFVDTDEIFRMEDAGMFQIEHLYASVGPER